MDVVSQHCIGAAGRWTPLEAGVVLNKTVGDEELVLLPNTGLLEQSAGGGREGRGREWRGEGGEGGGSGEGGRESELKRRF